MVGQISRPLTLHRVSQPPRFAAARGAARAVVSVVRRLNTEKDEGRGTYLPAMATVPHFILSARVRRGAFCSRPFARTVLP